MRGASDFEFKARFWIFGALFWVAFSLSAIDHQVAGVVLVDWIARLEGKSASDAAYHAIFAFGALFCIAAAALRTWATAYLNPEVMVDKEIHSSRLVADGPYRYVRNPLYFGNILLAIGFGCMASRVGFVVLVAGMIIFDFRLILREEAEIAATQGESYRSYCAAVPRLLPRFRPALPAAGGKPKWMDGFLGEAFMWVLAASVAAFAATLSARVFFIVLASAFVVYALCYALIRKRRGTLPPEARPAAGRPPGTLRKENRR